ncbi:MAG: T9SS type A sorting domain-containing protein [Flavobacteriales bacterium]|nr:T9SS type A sorting domain-containing protein [Flavobacteriales bacterium]
MKKTLLFLLGVIFAFSTQAQVTGISVEVVTEHDGMVGTADLTGFTTYRVYANTVNEGDFVSALFGLAGTPLEINTTTSFFQSEFGTQTGSTINGDVFEFFPDLEFDSWVTIGRAQASDPGADVTATQDASEPWVDNFAAGNNIIIDGVIGGAWFTLFGAPEIAPNGYATGNQVLIGQFTTDGVLSGFVNAQVFVNGDQEQEEQNTCFPFSSDPTAIFGCVEPIANNYDEEADVNDCSCDYTCTIAIDEVATTVTSCIDSNDGTATVTASGQQGAITYAIDGGSPVALNTFEGLSGGSHTVVVEDSQGCTAELTFDVPTPDPIVVELELTSTISCNGAADAVITATGTGGTGELMYDLAPELDNPVTFAEFGDLGPGLYTVYAVDENGCPGQSGNLTISNPLAVQVNITAQADATCSDTEDGTIVCIGTGGTGGLTYSIDGENFQAENVFNVGPGTYTVTATDVNGCTDVSDIIAEITAPDPISFAPDAVNPTCFGDTDGSISGAASGGNGGFEYVVNGGDPVNMVDLVDLAPGSYEFVITDSEGCEATVIVGLNEPEEVTAAVTVIDPACADDTNGSIDVTAAGGTESYTYSIDGGDPQNNPSFEDLGGGSYDITVIDSNGCEGSTTADVVNPDAIDVTDVTSNEESAAGENDGSIEITVEGGTGSYTFEWTQDGNVVSTDEDPTGLAGGDYTVVITDENDCTFELDVTVTTSVEELGAGMAFSVSPNPSNGLFFLNIEGLNGQAVSYRVVDASGRVIANEQINGTQTDIRYEINMTDVANGLYYLNLTVGTSTATTTIVKQF